VKLFGDIAVDWSICEQPYDQILQTNLESKGIYSQQAYVWKSWLKRKRPIAQYLSNKMTSNYT